MWLLPVLSANARRALLVVGVCRRLGVALVKGVHAAFQINDPLEKHRPDTDGRALASDCPHLEMLSSDDAMLSGTVLTLWAVGVRNIAAYVGGLDDYCKRCVNYFKLVDELQKHIEAASPSPQLAPMRSGSVIGQGLLRSNSRGSVMTTNVSSPSHARKPPVPRMPQRPAATMGLRSASQRSAFDFTVVSLWGSCVWLYRHYRGEKPLQQRRSFGLRAASAVDVGGSAASQPGGSSARRSTLGGRLSKASLTSDDDTVGSGGSPKNFSSADFFNRKVSRVVEQEQKAADPAAAAAAGAGSASPSRWQRLRQHIRTSSTATRRSIASGSGSGEQSHRSTGRMASLVGVMLGQRRSTRSPSPGGLGDLGGGGRYMQSKLVEEAAERVVALSSLEKNVWRARVVRRCVV